MKIKFVSIFKPKARSGRSDPWKLALSIGGNRRRVVTASADKQIAVEMAIRLSKVIDRVRAGISEISELHDLIGSQKPLREHIADWARDMRRRKLGRKHVSQYISYTKAALDGCETASQISYATVKANVEKLEFTSATKNRHFAAVRALVKWGLEPGNRRWDAKLLMDLQFKKMKHDRKARRVLSIEELGKLIAAADTGKRLYHCTGKQRSLVYRVTLAAALRANEIRRLEVRDVGETGIRIRPNTPNAKRGAFFQLPAELLAEVKEEIKGKPATARVFNLSDNLCHMIRLDMKRAGIPKETAEGVYNFHCLRHQSGALLISQGSNPKAVQKHMRHASIATTMDVYGHLLDRDREESFRAMGFLQDAISRQRLAQRAGFFEVRSGSLKGRSDVQETQENQWSDGESNPDLLNAIHRTDVLITLHRHELHDKRGRTVAPKAAHRLLHRMASRAMKKGKVSR